MNQVYFRKVQHDVEQDGKLLFSERLDINVDQQNDSQRFRHCSFSFHSQLNGIPNMEGHVSFVDDHEPTGISFSSGRLSMEVTSNFNAFDALLSRLMTLCSSGMTDEQILNDSRIQQILKNNNFIPLSEARGK